MTQQANNQSCDDDPDEPTIIVDVREKASGLARALREANLFRIEERTLEAGDIQIRDFVIERKAGADLGASLKDGRLFRQLILMRRVSRRRALLIEGEGRRASGMSERMWEGMLVRISLGLQTPILFSSSVEHSVALLQRAAMQIYGFTTPHATGAPPARDGNSRFYQTLALVSFPGVGLARARSLLAHFGTLRGVLNASRAELLAVPGIGPYHADRIIELSGAGGGEAKSS